MLGTRLRVALLSSVVSLTISAQALGGETIIHSFNPANHGGINPSGGLMMDGSGSFYGSALDGTIFEFKPNGSGGWTYNVLCNCSGTYGYGSLVMDKSGNLYGANYFGEVYQYSPGGPGAWSGNQIYAFSGPAGSGPSPLTLDSDGNLYGVYAYGGSHGKGFVFRLSQGSNGAWSLTHIHDFSGTDGATTSQNNAYTLVGGLTIDSSGDLYGTTGQGGTSANCHSGCGVVFKLTKSSGGWTEEVLHSFTGSDGINPDAPVLLDAAGNLYGTTTDGGGKGFGAVFEISAATGMTQDLYSFTNANGDGAYPNSLLVLDAAGNLFGTTEAGGGTTNCTVASDNGCGTVYELRKESGVYKESVLNRFLGEGNGGFPGGVSLGTDGNLYGVAEVGGGDNKGLFFKIPR